MVCHKYEQTHWSVRKMPCYVWWLCRKVGLKEYSFLGLRSICWVFVENRSVMQNFWSIPCICQNNKSGRRKGVTKELLSGGMSGQDPKKKKRNLIQILVMDPTDHGSQSSNHKKDSNHGSFSLILQNY